MKRAHSDLESDKEEETVDLSTNPTQEEPAVDSPYLYLLDELKNLMGECWLAPMDILVLILTCKSEKAFWTPRLLPIIKKRELTFPIPTKSHRLLDVKSLLPYLSWQQFIYFSWLAQAPSSNRPGNIDYSTRPPEYCICLLQTMFPQVAGNPDTRLLAYFLGRLGFINSVEAFVSYVNSFPRKMNFEFFLKFLSRSWSDFEKYATQCDHLPNPRPEDFILSTIPLHHDFKNAPIELVRGLVSTGQVRHLRPLLKYFFDFFKQLHDDDHVSLENCQNFLPILFYYLVSNGSEVLECLLDFIDSTPNFWKEYGRLCYGAAVKSSSQFGFGRYMLLKMMIYGAPIESLDMVVQYMTTRYNLGIDHFFTNDPNQRESYNDIISKVPINYREEVRFLYLGERANTIINHGVLPPTPVQPAPGVIEYYLNAIVNRQIHRYADWLQSHIGPMPSNILEFLPDYLVTYMTRLSMLMNAQGWVGRLLRYQNHRIVVDLVRFDIFTGNTPGTIDNMARVMKVQEAIDTIKWFLDNKLPIGYPVMDVDIFNRPLFRLNFNLPKKHNLLLESFLRSLRKVLDDNQWSAFITSYPKDTHIDVQLEWAKLMDADAEKKKKLEC